MPGGGGHARSGAAAPGQAPGSGDDLGAIVLAGGRASRLGGTDKPALRVGEQSLIESVLAEVSTAGARRVVVVGPDRPGLAVAAGELRVVREDPPGQGPVPALHRGLAEITAGSGGQATAPGGRAMSWMLLLAADLPFLRARHLLALLSAARGGQGRGSVLADDTGRPQWLASCWQAATLHRAAAHYRGNSLHGLLRPLAPVLLALPPDGPGPPPWLDCDTPQDVRRARAWSANVRAGGRGEEEDRMSALDDWTELVCIEFGLPSGSVDARLILGMARDVAHGVDRPAAPLTAYLLGLAVAGGHPAEAAAARISELAAGWDETGHDQEGSAPA